MRDFDDPNSATNLLRIKGYVVSSMTRWTLGERIYGDQRKGRFLSRLRPPPPEIWEVRVTEPVVQARLFGRMAEKDTLILTKFYTRQFLGKDSSAHWKHAMTECEKAWNDIFPDTPPQTGNSISDFISENFDDFPI